MSHRLHVGLTVLISAPGLSPERGVILDGPVFRDRGTAFKVRYDDGFENWCPVEWLRPFMRAL